jgi:hypothetical protein
MVARSKGFRPESEALVLIGGGETHSELLIGENYHFSNLAKPC